MSKISLARHIHLDRSIAMVLIATLVVWTVALPALVHRADAAFIQASDTLDDSDRGVDTNHTFQFTLNNNWDTGEIIRFHFDPTGNAFDVTGLTATEITISGGLINQVANLGACATANDVYALDAVEGPPDYFEIVACPGATVASATTVTVTTTNTEITNPDPGAGVSQSYVIRIGAQEAATPHEDRSDIRVNIHDDVLVTAIVPTILNFTISGIATGTADINGTTTTVGTYPQLIPFGELAPGNAEVGGQELTVETNALNGYSVTVEADQTLTSAIGATIDAFSNGATTTPPIGWVAPTNTLGSAETYGHWGVSSEDYTLNTGDPYGTALFAGNFITNPLEIMAATSSSDGVTDANGLTQVAYAIQIESLQEAADDYQATLTYVVTPVF